MEELNNSGIHKDPEIRGYILPASELGTFLKSVLGDFEPIEDTAEGRKLKEMADAQWNLHNELWFYATDNKPFESPRFIDLVCRAYDTSRDDVLRAMDVGYAIWGSENEILVRDYVIELFGGSELRELTRNLEASAVLFNKFYRK